MTASPKVDVLFAGGGYAAILAASRLSAAGLSVLIVDPRPGFTDRVRLHEAAAGAHPGTRPWAEVLPPGVRHAQDRVLRVAPGGADLLDAGGVTAKFVAITTGSRSRHPWSGPSVMPLETADDAGRIHARLQSLSAPRVAVIGAGATGLELSAALAEARPAAQLTLIDASGLPGLSEDGVEKTRARLDALGVRLLRARVLALSEGALHTDAGELPVDLILPCPGFEAPPLARDSGLPVDESGRVAVNDDLSVIGHSGLFAAGDAAFLPSQPWVGRGCAAAMPMGAHLADTLLALHRGEAPRPFAFAWPGKQIALGRRGGVIQMMRWDGTPTRALSGRWVGWTKEAVSRMVEGMPRWERALGLPLFTWQTPPRGAAELETR